MVLVSLLIFSATSLVEIPKYRSRGYAGKQNDDTKPKV